MNSFDERVNRLVEGKFDEVMSLLRDSPDNFADLEAAFAPVIDKLNRLHNLLADVKQEVRRIEKEPKEKKKKKKKPEEQDVPNDNYWPEGVDPSNLIMEDLKNLLPDESGSLVPYEPTQPVRMGLMDALKRLFDKLDGLSFPGSPEWWKKGMKGYADRWADLLTSMLTPSELWTLITNPGAFQASPTWKEILQSLILPDMIAQSEIDGRLDLKRQIQEFQAKQNAESAESKRKLEDIIAKQEQAGLHLDEAVTGIVDTADDLAQQILTEVVTCCATTSQKLDRIKNVLDQGGGPVVKQDTLLVRKKVNELDTLIEELRRELRRLIDVRTGVERWFDERRRDAL